jgi:class 3 adenylate cyclase
MMAALSELNQKWEEHGQKTLDHGIGISTGMMNVGLFGSRKIQSITVMGGVVNLGARLEAYSRKTDASIIISEPTCQDVGDKATVRPLGNITVKGFSEPVPVYSLEAMVPESQAQSA